MSKAAVSFRLKTCSKRRLVARESQPLASASRSVMSSKRGGRCLVCMGMQPATKACGKCRKIWYCCVQCQKDDWREHKKVCCTAESVEVETAAKDKFKEAQDVTYKLLGDLEDVYYKKQVTTQACERLERRIEEWGMTEQEFEDAGKRREFDKAQNESKTVAEYEEMLAEKRKELKEHEEGIETCNEAIRQDKASRELDK